MANLQEFMFIFRYEPTENQQPNKEELAQEANEWGKFIGGIASQAKLVSVYQLCFDAVQISSDETENEGIYISDKKTVDGTMVVKATSIEEATTLSKQCPILKIGGTIEVRSVIPM